MDSIWKTAFKVTGSVGVIGLIFSILIKALFEQEIISLLGSERLFYIVILLICILGIAIIIAILRKNKPANGSTKVVYKDHSMHQGDNRF